MPAHKLGSVIIFSFSIAVRLRSPFKAAVFAMIISYLRTKPPPRERVSFINYVYVVAITLWTFKIHICVRTSTMGTGRSLVGDYLTTVVATNECHNAYLRNSQFKRIINHYPQFVKMATPFSRTDNPKGGMKG